MSTNSTTPADATIIEQQIKCTYYLILDCKGTVFFGQKKRVLFFLNIFLILVKNLDKKGVI
jgi:hypothetical protein